LQPVNLDLISYGPAQTAQIGIRLGQLLAGGDLICLFGELGAGKTALAAGIGKGWGALEPVNSPTFVFVHEYQRRQDELRLYHLDCYRLNDPEEAATIGIEDILASGNPVMIEWPERITSLLPQTQLWISLESVESADDMLTRRLTFRAFGPRYEALLKAFGS
jgi:tRNA threonylcarbamoyladenosine biosynthesis protein TsaE